MKLNLDKLKSSQIPIGKNGLVADNTRVQIKKKIQPIPLTQEQQQNLKWYGTLNKPQVKQTYLSQGKKKTIEEQKASDKRLAELEEIQNYQKQKVKEAEDLQRSIEIAPYLIPGIGQAMWAGKAVDLATNGISKGKYKSWGNMVDQKTGSGEFIGDLTNPGYYAGLVGKVASPLIKKGIQNSGEYLTTRTLLKDAWKLNPYAFKPNPEAYYRGIGRSGFDDAIKSKVLRTANKTGDYGENLYMAKNFDMARGNYSIDQSYGVGDPFSDDWKMVQPKDKRSYIAEIPKKNVGNIVDQVFAVYNKGAIPINDVRLLKQDWLSRYKDITPKTTIHFQSK